jgi:pyruvate/2-oxoglutarate/acetoin dehydrogenase E1 component
VENIRVEVRDVRGVEMIDVRAFIASIERDGEGGITAGF